MPAVGAADESSMTERDRETDYVTKEPARCGAGHLVVMWVCWVLLVLMLVAAGVVVSV